MERKDISIMVVDDEAANRDLLRRFFGIKGITNLAFAASGKEALETAGRTPLDLVFVDINLPGGMNGFETVRSLKDKAPAARFVMISGYSSEDYPETREEPRIIGFLEKPFDFNAVISCIDKVCETGQK